ncbi:MAG: hypothetical protein HY722_16080 [Planctomycetes bacterium]|nr:hypothetical protein [Planctomycetota bacterium]
MERRPHVLAPISMCAALGLVALAAPARADNRFLRELIDKPNATFSDAVKVLHVLAVGDTPKLEYEPCLVALVKRRVVSLDWDLDPDAKLTWGQFSIMIFRALDLKGGISTRLLTLLWGLNDRYAYRELTYLRIVPESGQHEFVSGEEVLTTLRRAQTWRDTGVSD